MLKAAGAGLLLLGAWGFAYSICREQKKQLLLLKDIREMYRLMQNEISYTALPLPEIFASVSEKLKEPFDELLLTISREMDREKGEDFSKVWKGEMGKKLTGISMKGPCLELLLHFPDCIGMNESEGQAKAMDRYIEELDRMIRETEEEEKSKNKVIMSLGIAAGLLMVIILL